MMLTNFTVVHGARDFESRGPLIHCFEDKRLVLAVVRREALDDLFPSRPLPPHARNTLVENNLAAICRIVAAKYESGEVTSHSGYGVTRPLVVVDLSDIQRSGEKLTDKSIERKLNFSGRDARL